MGYIFLVLYLCFLVSLSEFLYRGKYTLNWIKNHGNSFIFTFITLLLLFIMIDVLILNAVISLILISSFYLIISIINKNKISYRGDPLFPWDFEISKESRDMLKTFGDKNMIMDITLVVINISLIFVFRNVFYNLIILKNMRVVFFLISILLLCKFYVFPNKKIQNKVFKLEENIFELQDKSFYNLGVLIFLLKNIKSKKIEIPSNYSKKNSK